MSHIENARRLRPLMEQAVQSLDDAAALDAVELHPKWAEDTEYTAAADRSIGFKVQHDGKVWKLRSEHTSQAGWEPGAAGTESLWEKINETHAGTLEDPIPYDGNMALTAGLYYSQNGTIYLCTRDTVNPVYNDLADLVGIYVETV